MRFVKLAAVAFAMLSSSACATRGQVGALEKRTDDMGASLQRIEEQFRSADRRVATAEQTAKDAARAAEAAEVAAGDAMTAAKKTELIFNKSLRK